MPSMWAVLTQERADLTREALALSEAAASRTPPGYTAEEQARDDAIAARQAQITPMLAREEERREWERTVAAVPSGPHDVARVTAVHDRASDKPFASLGEQLQAIYRASIPGGSFDPRLGAVLGMNETVPADGGFLVQQDLQAGILRRMYETGELLRRVRKIPVSANSNGIKINALAESSRATGSRWGGVQGYWIEEGGTKIASRPQFRQIKLELNKLAALGYATDELLQDTAALDAVMTDSFRDELTFLAEAAVLTGTGAGQPLGILNSGALITVTAETGQEAATIDYLNVIKMWARLYGPSKRSAVWIANADITPSLMTMSMGIGTGGMPVWMPAGGIANAPFETLMGRPIIDVEYSPTLGTIGDLLLIDPEQYLWIDKGGIQQATSIHVAFVTDETAFRAVFRCDGAPAWEAPLTPFQGTATRSPFVALATR
jgi:HK97 family phage major capsid protein